MVEKAGGAPKGTRTPVFAVRGRRPGPLDDGSGGAAARERPIYRRGASEASAPRRSQLIGAGLRFTHVKLVARNLLSYT